MMLEFPSMTGVDRRLPKQKFYENLTISPALKKSFVDQLRTIYWKNKLSAETLNLAPGEKVNEIEFFLLRLNQRQIDEGILRQIDREIPYHIIFVLEYEDEYQAWVGYKEATTGANAFRVVEYYHTKWLRPEELSLRVDGLNLDAVYESLVRQIAGEVLQQSAAEETIQESVERTQRRAQLQREIDKLQAKIKKEKQLNRQMEMNAEMKRLKRELEI